jgi:hypothetical protein
MDSEKVNLQSSWDTCSVDNSTMFCNVNSCPIALTRVPEDKRCELLAIFLNTLYSDIWACRGPETYLEKDNLRKTKFDDCLQTVELASTTTRLANLRQVTAEDGMHVVPEGYENLNKERGMRRICFYQIKI